MLSVMAAMDFNDLAARMSGGVAGVRACLILSKDGLSLGVHPADAEARARHAWEALQRIGDPQRGFVDMGTEIWVVATGGAYGAAMVATPEAKPGLLLDRMEAQLLAAEESRSMESQDPVMAMAKVVDLSAAAAQPRPQASEPPPMRQGAAPAAPPAPAAPEAPAAPPAPSPPPRPARVASVDRVALAREFSRLMDNGPEGGH
jgi:hypothetical protein